MTNRDITTLVAREPAPSFEPDPEREVDRWRIGLVGPLPPPSGGMANQTRQLHELLTWEGLAVETVRVNSPYRPSWVGRVRGVRALFRLLPYMSALWRAAGRADLFHVMGSSGWSWHLFAAPAVWVAWLRRVPVVINYRGGEAQRFFRRSWPWVRPTLRRATAVVVPSTFLEGVFSERGVRVTVVPNVVDLERFAPSDRGGVSGPHRSNGGPCIVVTRNLEPIYDIATAIRAFAEIRRVHHGARLIIAGSGPEAGRLEGLVQRLDLGQAVTFTGRLDNRELPALYQRADLLLNPSLADNMPISLLEALASGVPIVTTDVGGVPYMLENGKDALLVPPADAGAMARAALQVLEDPALAARLRQAGIARVRECTWDEVRARLLGTYARALGGSARDGLLQCPPQRSAGVSSLRDH